MFALTSKQILWGFFILQWSSLFFQTFLVNYFLKKLIFTPGLNIPWLQFETKQTYIRVGLILLVKLLARKWINKSPKLPVMLNDEKLLWTRCGYTGQVWMFSRGVTGRTEAAFLRTNKGQATCKGLLLQLRGFCLAFQLLQLTGARGKKMWNENRWRYQISDGRQMSKNQDQLPT